MLNQEEEEKTLLKFSGLGYLFVDEGEVIGDVRRWVNLEIDNSVTLFQNRL